MTSEENNTKLHGDPGRSHDDEVLVAAAIREAIVRSWLSVASDVTYFILLNLAVFTFLLPDYPAANLAIMYGPLAVGVFFWVRGLFLAKRAKKHFVKLPLWERHRINLVLERVAKKGNVL